VGAQTDRLSAQAPARDALTLPLAVDIALRTNPLMRAVSSGREIADAQLDGARASRLPLIQFSETFARGNNPVFVFGSLLEQGRFGAQNFDPRFLNNPDPINNFRSALSFRMPVFDQRRASSQIKQARLGQEQADSEQDLAEQQLRFEVVKAFYGALVARARLDVARDAVKTAEADVKRIHDLFDTGVVVQSDLLAAEVQLSEFRQQLIQLEGDSITAEAALNTALGVDVGTRQNIAGQLVDKTFNVESQQDLVTIAMRNRPEYRRATLAFRASTEQSRSARGELTPRVEVFGTYGFSGRDFSSGSADYTVGASLTFNIFDAGRSARIRQARAAEALAGSEQERIASQIRFEVIRAYQQFVSARERIVVASRAVDQAKETLRIVQDRYQAGLTTITEVLRAETTFVRAQTMLLAARYDHYLGYAGVLLSSGRLVDVRDFIS
jgi:outer membrane protein TolC